MKKISKLVVNPEKVMTDEELVTLRGGYEDLSCSSTTTEQACSYPGMYIGHGCCWSWNGNVWYGRCQSFYGNPMHCSDLN